MTTATSTNRSRTWQVLGGILILLLLCLASLVFVVNRYRSAMTAYAWVQSTTDTSADLNELLCKEAPQARRFNTAFRSRYAGQDLRIDLKDFEQNGNEVILSGEIIIEDDKDDFEARFLIGEGNTGFLGLFGCIEYIELSEPNIIPQHFLGG
ncbi:MAG: hypothetical protein CUN55_09315 [Phototrophicales bacterium]|nr:MAG: hypothetical protein CUN55_09315 [Phototrophicales bacterium]